MVRYYLLILFAIGLVACDGENDDEIPTVVLNNITTQGTISNDTIFSSATQSLEFDCSFSDNMELNQARIKAIPQASNSLHPFYTLYRVIEVETLSDLEADLDFELNPLESTNGTYDVEITALDEQGNQSNSIDYVWVITTNFPIVQLDSIQNVDPENGFTTPIDTLISLEGGITSSVGLASIQVDWLQDGLIMDTDGFNFSGETSLDLSTLSFNAPSTAGSYEMEITAVDTDSNEITCEVEATIEE
ncbi:MAG: hypothetical protein HRT74_07620 [Flavobacteriales bacterium]|nr:hypothetical protein [Flavobacteriales bacterium]